jgi:hypothetical protein
MYKASVPVLITAAALVTSTALAGNGSPLNPHSSDPLTIAVFGDAPYGTTPTDTSEFEAAPAFIDSINSDPKVDLVLHVGDIHSGKQYCTESYDRAVFDLWKAFKDPLIYTPGDNEWTDCHKPAEGGGTYNATTQQIDYVRDAAGNLVDYAGGDPIANLNLVRSVFFSKPGYALGGRKKQVLTQAREYDRAHPSDAKYVENVIWEESKVVFVVINLPGGSNNDNDVWYGAPTRSAAQNAEIAERTGADLRWLELAFQIAEGDDAHAVVIQAQADMWDPEKGAAHQAAFEPYVASVAGHTLSFGKPVLMLNGDSHVYLSHNPLSASDSLNALHPGYDVPNFHRIVVHGSTFPLEWLKLTIDPRQCGDAQQGPDSFGPFSWTRVTE